MRAVDQRFPRAARTCSIAGFSNRGATAVKTKFGFTKVRYKGLAKNAHRLFVTCALANLYMVRKKLLCPTGA